MESDSQPESKSVRSSVFDRIECEKICPRSRLFFLSQECLVWLLWGASVLVGSLAVAVTIFVFSYHQYALYEATHENALTFVVEVLPYLWIGLFALMALVAVYNLRHTKHGYRYPLWKIFSSSLVLSLAGGATLQIFGLGYTVDHLLGQQMRMYLSQERMEEKFWQDPGEGRLIGHLSYRTMAPTSTIIFNDSRGEAWQVDISELSEAERMLIESESTVRLIGQSTDDESNQFHSCGAFALTAKMPMSREDMKQAREAFVLKVENFKERIKSQEGEIEAAELGEDSPCVKMAPVRRMNDYKGREGNKPDGKNRGGG